MSQGQAGWVPQPHWPTCGCAVCHLQDEVQALERLLDRQGGRVLEELKAGRPRSSRCREATTLIRHYTKEVAETRMVIPAIRAYMDTEAIQIATALQRRLS